ncbi:MAG: Rpn family recombination-promoting nuclease/putative transposase [Treponema sp.]|nr:Rpn family recombination-promoting nuclease/putative transposase [Treponema sp.]
METNIHSNKSYDELTFADNFLFCKILETNPDLCKQIIELLLDIQIDHLEIPQSELAMQEAIDSKSVRFDVFTKNDKQIFDLEIQTTQKTNLPQRARYYQSIIDVDNLNKGTNYSKLKHTYVIFICTKDIFSKGFPVYFFENICREDNSLKLKDKTYKVFFNASAYAKIENKELREFFKFLLGKEATTSLTKTLADKVDIAKKNSTWRHLYMTWQQTIDEEVEAIVESIVKDACEKASQKSIEDTSVQNAINALKLGLSVDQVGQITGLPIERIKELKEEL